MKTAIAPVIAVRKRLEQDLTAVLRLKSESRQLLVSLLVTGLAFAVFLLFERKDFFEGGLGYRSRDVIFTVQIL